MGTTWIELTARRFISTSTITILSRFTIHQTFNLVSHIHTTLTMTPRYHQCSHDIWMYWDSSIHGGVLMTVFKIPIFFAHFTKPFLPFHGATIIKTTSYPLSRDLHDHILTAHNTYWACFRSWGSIGNARNSHVRHRSYHGSIFTIYSVSSYLSLLLFSILYLLVTIARRIPSVVTTTDWG